MTKREMYEAIVNGNVTEEVVEMAHAEIEKMNARNAKRASQPSKKAIENRPIMDSIVEFLKGSDERVTASVIGSAVEISTQKASALCRQLVADGTLTVTDIKVKGKGTQKGYAVA